MIGNVYGWKSDELFAFVVKIPVAVFVPIAGIAYVLGYAVNYVFGLIGLNSAGDRLIPWSQVHRVRGWIARLLFFCLNRFPMQEVAAYIDHQVNIENHTDLRPSAVYALQALHPRQDYVSRAITLHHLGSVVGSSLVVSGVLLLTSHFHQPAKFSLLLSIVTLAIGILLCLDSNYRSSQIAFAILMVHKWKPELESERDL